ncbi:hypothetical protein V8E36_009871 [Tilletia maclaganii]
MGRSCVVVCAPLLTILIPTPSVCWPTHSQRSTATDSITPLDVRQTGQQDEWLLKARPSRGIEHLSPSYAPLGRLMAARPKRLPGPECCGCGPLLRETQVFVRAFAQPIHGSTSSSRHLPQVVRSPNRPQTAKRQDQGHGVNH